MKIYATRSGSELDKFVGKDVCIKVRLGRFEDMYATKYNFEPQPPNWIQLTGRYGEYYTFYKICTAATPPFYGCTVDRFSNMLYMATSDQITLVQPVEVYDTDEVFVPRR